MTTFGAWYSCERDAILHSKESKPSGVPAGLCRTDRRCTDEIGQRRTILDLEKIREEADYKTGYAEGFDEGLGHGGIVVNMPMLYANKADAAQGTKEFPHALGMAEGFASGFHEANPMEDDEDY